MCCSVRTAMAIGSRGKRKGQAMPHHVITDLLTNTRVRMAGPPGHKRVHHFNDVDCTGPSISINAWSEGDDPPAPAPPTPPATPQPAPPVVAQPKPPRVVTMTAT